MTTHCFITGTSADGEAFTAWNDRARAVLATVEKYETEHPAGAPCFAEQFVAMKAAHTSRVILHWAQQSPPPAPAPDRRWGWKVKR